MKLFSYLTAILFALALTFTSATQLRLSGLPIGVGELLLVSWLLLIPFEFIRIEHISITTVTRWTCGFWYLSFLFLLIGFWIGIAEGLWDTTGFHDITAYLFISVLFITLSMIHPPSLYMKVAAKWFLIFSFMILIFIYLLAQLTSSLGPISFWYWDRFTGWSTNPNQLALHITVSLWICGYYLLTTSDMIRKIGYFIMVVCLAWVGWSTKSDSLLISSISSISLYVTVRLIMGKEQTPLLPKTSVVARWVRYLLVIVVASTVCILLYQPVMSQVESIYNDGHQGSLRFLLWGNGLSAIAASPLFGAGPGAHSGRGGPFEGFEAHNTLIDWGGSAGILGVLVLVALYVYWTYVCWRANQLYLLVSLLMIFQFSFFHYVLRQPIFWFLMTWVMTVSISKARELNQKVC
ncbi:O-antigen ligase family protein [Brevibacillus sp. SYSU BS000544]|uniref:O-antigen ligase family protein n=1 Tax=Brevibacillus sp. SYSU BS000544 TaxID=3416443 RepID=UPI003CE5C11C